MVEVRLLAGGFAYGALPLADGVQKGAAGAGPFADGSHGAGRVGVAGRKQKTA